jgi:hypothetical protein
MNSNGEGQRKEIYYRTWAAVGRGKVSIQPIFSHLHGTDTSLVLMEEEGVIK